MERLCELCHDFVDRAFAEISSDASAEVTTERSFWSFRDGIKAGCLVCRVSIKDWKRPLSEAANEVLESPHDNIVSLPLSNTQITIGLNNSPYYPALPRQSSLHVQLMSIIPVTLQQLPLDTPWQKNGDILIWNEDLWMARPDLNPIAVRELASCTDERGPYSALVSQIYQWIQADTASSGHPAETLKHQASTGQWLYPSRLVRLTELDNAIFKIETTAGWEPGRSFAALSYRWSTEPALLLSRRNIRLLEAGVSVEKMDKNMYEAVRLVRDLGIDYIWIDALCIVQDSPAEWQIESVQMERIYSTAILTLAMHNDIDEEVPLLRSLCDNLAQMRWPHCLASSHVEVLEKSISDLIGQAPLSNRAWCLQERLLAQRIAHILPSTVAWEGTPDESPCISDLYHPAPTSSMRGIYPLASRFNLYETVSHTRDLRLLQRKNSTFIIDQGFIESWLMLLRDYRKRRLTFESDSLVALEAVVQRLRILTGYTYFLGIWTEFLPFCLGWSIYHPEAFESELPLPSWCWARYGNRASGPPYFKENFGLMTIHQASSDENAMVLNIRGALLGPYRDDRTSTYKSQFSYNEDDAKNVSSNDSEKALGGVMDVLQDLGAAGFEVPFAEAYFDVEILQQSIEQIWLSPLTLHPYTDDNTFELTALILTRVSEDDHKYRRIGLWRVFSEYGPQASRPKSPYDLMENASAEVDTQSGSSCESRFLQKQATYRLV